MILRVRLSGLFPKLEELRRIGIEAVQGIRQIQQEQGNLVATIKEAIQGWQDYTTELKTQRDAAIASLSDANDRATKAAQDLADFQANDAETDAAQLAQQAQDDADAVQAALDAAKATADATPDQPPAPVDDSQPTPTEDAPVETPADGESPTV